MCINEGGCVYVKSRPILITYKESKVASSKVDIDQLLHMCVDKKKTDV